MFQSAVKRVINIYIVHLGDIEVCRDPEPANGLGFFGFVEQTVKGKKN
jgi:hypothetical protein